MSPTMASRPMQITQFILAPHSLAPQMAATDSFFSRAMSVMRSHRPSHSRSFTLSRVPQSLPPPYTSQSTLTLTADVEASAPTQPLTPFLVHHDRTPVLTFGSFTGLIEIDAVEEKLLGVDRSFWIAVSLTYLEFLENREVSESAHLFVIAIPNMHHRATSLHSKIDSCHPQGAEIRWLCVIFPNVRVVVL